MRVPAAYLERRRQEILEAAAACFGRQGVRGTTIKEICTEGQFSPGIVYRHFKSKDEIVAGVFERFSDHELESLTRSLALVQVDAALGSLIAALIEDLRSGDAFALDLIAEASRDEGLREKLVEHERRISQLIAETLRRRIGGRGVNELREDGLIEAIILLREGFRVLLQLQRDNPPGAEALDSFTYAITPGAH